MYTNKLDLIKYIFKSMLFCNYQLLNFNVHEIFKFSEVLNLNNIKNPKPKIKSTRKTPN